jgi:type IV pilus assembly protein PilV
MQLLDGMGKICVLRKFPAQPVLVPGTARSRQTCGVSARTPLMSGWQRQRGLSLIEVLVAVLIFGVAVLGIALMQLKGAQFTKQAGARTVAVLQARSLADAMRANPAGVYGVSSTLLIGTKSNDLSGSYYLISSNTAPAVSSCGSSNQPCIQAKQDLKQWLGELAKGTPLSTGSDPTTVLGAVAVATDGTGRLKITSTWNGTRPDASGNNINDSYTFNYQPYQQ